MIDKDILEFVQSSKRIIDADSDDENEMNNAEPLCFHIIRNEERHEKDTSSKIVVSKRLQERSLEDNLLLMFRSLHKYEQPLYHGAKGENGVKKKGVKFRSCGSNKTVQYVHTARATIDLLKDTLGDRLISRFGPVNWPPRSCDLTPLDYFLWGYVKSALVYADKATSA
ncbi:hypothetical protein TNCV_1506961 [Trichonephila clavipes]|nr:hypothetical protein TNCV_1506961 [Trichonephila clavipes]